MPCRPSACQPQVTMLVNPIRLIEAATLKPASLEVKRWQQGAAATRSRYHQE